MLYISQSEGVPQTIQLINIIETVKEVQSVVRYIDVQNSIYMGTRYTQYIYVIPKECVNK